MPSAISLAVDLAVLLVGEQDHHDVAARGGVGDVEHLEALAARACSTDEESGRRPTTTSTPESLRFSAWAWPCEP